MTTNVDPATFTKEYRDPAICSRAATNYRWLAGLSTAMTIPDLLSVRATRLVFAFCPGTFAGPADLLPLAEHLGDVHGAVYRARLYRGHLGQPFTIEGGQVINGFPHHRLGALERRLSSGIVPAPTLSLAAARECLSAALDEPAAIYKDANPRNFLVRPGQRPVTVDFDDVTLAPFSYDLAKLIVTLGMTHGRIPAPLIGRSLTLYNQAARRQHPALGRISPGQLLTWAEFHHILTSPYLGRGGYRYSWSEMRPAADDLRIPPPADDEGNPWP